MGRGYLIDMDGVIYRGGELIPGAEAFIHRLAHEEIPYMFLTNNSQRTRRDVVTKLNRMGIEVEDHQVFTCAMATARFLARQHPQGTAFVIGEGGLLAALHTNGYAVIDHDPDYVVVGEGRTVTHAMLDHAVQLILDGAKLIAKNLDPNCPTQVGTRAGCGATVAYLETATGRRAMNMGKPIPIMLRQARHDLGKYAYRPDLVIDSLADLTAPEMNLKTVIPLGSRSGRLSGPIWRAGKSAAC